ncbi:MAG: decarboxylating NADP(+)-dependent phosphogluconate dehydrogenase [Deinococcota bacterium]
MMADAQADIGVIGLAVMGQNLILNMNDHGFKVAVYNRTTSKVDDFMADEAKDTEIVGAQSLEEFVGSLKRPRRVMLMIKAGKPVDATIEQLIPLLEEGDIIIDGGNSNYEDSMRRTKMLEEKGLRFLGTGVSGGEEGARFGPSIMPGGSPDAWEYVKPIFQGIAAKVDDVPCCDWVGENGAGHYVKMVHNGIEYGDMQIIAEAYDLMSTGLGMSNAAMHEVFGRWNKGKLDSYLIEITTDILGYQEDGEYLIDVILDAAGQKGTGRWTAVSSLDMGIPLTLISEAVAARSLSALKDERMQVTNHLSSPGTRFDGDKEAFVNDLEDAVYASKIVSYAQGYMLMRAAAEAYDWNLNYGGLALMWRGGCIIRSVFLNNIKDAYDRDPNLVNLLVDPYFQDAIANAQAAWRRVIAKAVELGIAVPAMSAALSFYDGYRRGRLPANMIQAQRDYFGAHTYERTDKPRGEYFHTNWTGTGGDVSSSSYDA